MEEDIIVVMCHYKNIAHTVGQWTHCCNCNKRVWISHSVINAAKHELEKMFVILCFTCGFVKLEEERKYDVAKPTAEQLNEINIAINKQYN